MSILVIGVNHRTGPLSVLERLALPADELPKAITAIAGRDNVREAVVVSTCNRTEVYAVAEKFHGAYADIRDFFCNLGDISADELHPHLYTEHDRDAVRHLFAVAGGIESAVLGDSEILGQVRRGKPVDLPHDHQRRAGDAGQVRPGVPAGGDGVFSKPGSAGGVALYRSLGRTLAAEPSRAKRQGGGGRAKLVFYR